MPFFHHDDRLQAKGDRLLAKTWEQFPTLARNQLALTWVVYDDPVIVNTGGAIAPSDFWQQPVRGFSYRGVECSDPAELTHLFYLVAIHEWIERGMVTSSTELERAMQDMLLPGSHDAAGLVVDTLTGTTSGPELPPPIFHTWQQQRNLVNRYFQSLQWPELETTNVSQKTWAGSAYGRERQSLGPMFEHRNQLTTDGVTRLMHSIVGGVAVSAGRSHTMMTALKHYSTSKQLALIPNLPDGSACWSMIGSNKDGCYSVAYLEIPNAQPFLSTLFVSERIEPKPIMLRLHQLLQEEVLNLHA